MEWWSGTKCSTAARASRRQSAFGIDTPTRLTLSYFQEEENNLPDYGIPFIDGVPAHVDRNNYYGLVNYDSTRTNTNIGTIRFEHDLRTTSP